MSRTATTTGLSRQYKRWVLIAADDVLCGDQFDHLVSLRGLPNDDFSVVKYQESDGKAIYEEFLTTEETKIREAKNLAANKAMAEWDKKVEEDRKAMLAKHEDERSLRHAAEIEALNAKGKQSLGQNKVYEDNVPADKKFVDKDGKRTDGPTLEDWLVHGMKTEKYPPDGYAARQSPAWDKLVADRTAAANDKAAAEAQAKAEAEAKANAEAEAEAAEKAAANQNPT